jgi:hypothetical protein
LEAIRAQLDEGVKIEIWFQDEGKREAEAV